MIQVFSDIKLHFAYLLEWADAVPDYYEQFPLLPVEETLTLSERLGVRLPIIQIDRRGICAHHPITVARRRLNTALDYMNLEDWRVLARAINRDIEMLTRASKTQVDVRSALRTRRESPTEEQIIDADSFGVAPGAPREIFVAGSRLKIWKIHRAGLDLSDVKGADLYYELGNRKFVLVQYKKSNTSDRVVLDRPQLEELKKACPVDCLPTNRFCCGSWYALHRKKNTVYFTACEVRELFGEYESRKADRFVNGLTHQQFLEEFGSCMIGARTRPVRAAVYRTFSVENDRVVFRVKNKDPQHLL